MNQESLIVEQPTGLEDVVRSLRALVRSSRQLGGASVEVLEREMATAIDISEKLRDHVVSPEAIDRARDNHLASEIRLSAHKIVDIVADLSTVTVLSTIDFVENFVDQPRPPLKSMVTGKKITK